MGKIKAMISIVIGLVLVVFMFKNSSDLELSPVGAGLMLLGFGFLALPFIAYVIRQASQRWYHILSIAGYSLLAVCLSVILVFTVIMVSAANDNLDRAPKNSAVVVLGCLLHGDKPSEMLKNRLDVADDYLKSHPDAECVVCGGYIGDYTQGAVMKKYLEEKGITASRILVDDKSDTTYENIRNAKALLSGKKNIIIATDVYHQYRSKFYAKRLSLTAYALPSKTPFSHYPDSWLREYLAVVKAWMTGK